MNLVGKIICRTAGIVGMGVALYDATKSANYYSKSGGIQEESEYLEKSYANTRTLSSDSFTNSAAQKKGFELMTQNQLPGIYGRTKGWLKGLCNSLADNLLIVGSASFALLGKGLFAKLGAIGVGLGICYNLLHNVIGLGKNNPMN